jgi:AcrR family transcriptional regulator
MARETRLRARKQPRQARALVTVEAILTAAAQVFQRFGYAVGTTDRIAERAGVSVGSLYQYFPNKDAILVALAERHIDAGFERLRSLLAEVRSAPGDLQALLRRFVEAMLALHAGEPRLHRVLFEEAPLPAGLRRGLERREQAFAGEIRALLETLPGVCVRDPALAAHLLVQTVDGLVHGFVLHPPPEIDPAAFVDEVAHMLHSYLTDTRRGSRDG